MKKVKDPFDYSSNDREAYGRSWIEPLAGWAVLVAVAILIYLIFGVQR